MGLAFGIIAVIGLTIFIIGCIGMNKRKIIYDEYKEYFGFIKAYVFMLSLVMGIVFTIVDIMRFLEDDNSSWQNVDIPPFVGIILLVLAVFIGISTSKKAKANGVKGVVMKMLLASLGGVVSVFGKFMGVFIPILADHGKREHERWLEYEAQRQAELEAKKNVKVYNAQTGTYYKVSRDGERYLGDDGEWHRVDKLKQV